MRGALLLGVVCLVGALCANTDDGIKIALWDKSGLIELTNSTKIQTKCKAAVGQMLQAADSGDLSALKMLDATGKLPSGILSGNINQYGDFSECMSVGSGQYCLAEIDPEPLAGRVQYYEKYRELVHSYYYFRETFNDPAHRVPGFSLIRWGFCIPDKCSSEDLRVALEEKLGVRAQIRPGMCQKASEDPKPLTLGAKIARIILGGLLATVGISSLLDYICNSLSQKGSLPDRIYQRYFARNPNVVTEAVMCFSIPRNVKDLLRIKEETDRDIAGVHGFRSFNALALLMCHKSMCMLFNPYMNRTNMIEQLSESWSILGKNAIIYTDSFIFLSGLLTAHSLLSDLSKKGSMNFKDRLIARIFRDNTRIKDMLKELGWMKFKDMLEMNALSFVHRVNLQLTPDYLKDKLTRFCEVHDPNTRNRKFYVDHRNMSSTNIMEAKIVCGYRMK